MIALMVPRTNIAMGTLRLMKYFLKALFPVILL